MNRHRTWIPTVTLAGLLAVGIVGCTSYEPQINAGVDAAKGGIDRADAYLSRLLGVEKPANGGAPESLPTSQMEPPQALGADQYSVASEPTATELDDARNQLVVLANKGDADAHYALATAYAIDGRSPEDKTEAVRWFRAAAEQGHAEAQFRMAEAYLNGIGIERDDQKAVEWYRKAAENGHRESQFMLGHLHVLGKGVGRDPQEALRWFSAAARQGHPLAGGRQEILDNQTSAARTLVE